MPVPEEFIEIADFSPGIHSDMYSAPHLSSGLSDPAALTRATGQADGAATVENTWACRADTTGALVPLPRAFAAGVQIQGIPDNLYTTATRPATYATAYLLDAEVSPPRWYYNPTTGNPLTLGSGEISSVYTMWGFFKAPAADGVANGYFLYVLGREYRINAPFSPNDFYDFIFSRSDIRFGSGPSLPILGFPTGSLCLSRLDNGANPTVVAAFGVIFSTKATTPVVVGLVSFALGSNPFGITMQTGAPSAAELAWLSDNVTTAGAPATTKKPSAFSPAILTSGTPAGRNGNVVVGMSLGTDGYDIGAAHPVDEWSFHTRDDAEITTEQNAPYIPYMIVPHQSRIVMPDLTGVRDFYAGRENDPATATDAWNMYFSDDILWYSRWGQPIGDPYTVTAVEYFRGWIPLQVAEDQVAKIGVIGAVTADELLVVKARGGGALIRGDLDNPTVRRLPHIEPTGNITSKGVQTPIGFVYGTKTGVFVFDGGDATKKLSTQLDGFFWNPYEEDDIVLEGSYGRFAYWNNMVLVPNNYAFDIDQGGWWRLFPPQLVGESNVSTRPAYNIYIVNNVGQLWAFPYKVPDAQASNVALFNSYNVDRLAGKYSWQSQPLMETRDRRLSFQDIRLKITAQDAAEVEVTLSGYTETGAAVTPVTTTLVCSGATVPQMLREDVAANFSAQYVQVRIKARAASFSSFDAPKIHSIRFGIRGRQSTPRAG